MWCTQNFAFIADGEVQDVVVCDDYNIANELAVNMYGKDAIALDCTHYALQKGDIYFKQKFYRDGEEILPEPTVEDKINELIASTTNLEEATCDLNDDYEQRIIDIEEALCELAEIINGEVD